MWSDIWNVSYIELRICNQMSYDHRSYTCCTCAPLKNLCDTATKIRIKNLFLPFFFSNMSVFPRRSVSLPTCSALSYLSLRRILRGSNWLERGPESSNSSELSPSLSYKFNTLESVSSTETVYLFLLYWKVWLSSFSSLLAKSRSASRMISCDVCTFCSVSATAGWFFEQFLWSVKATVPLIQYSFFGGGPLCSVNNWSLLRSNRSGPLAFRPFLKWQPHTRECFLGSRSSLLLTTKHTI